MQFFERVFKTNVNKQFKNTKNILKKKYFKGFCLQNIGKKAVKIIF